MADTATAYRELNVVADFSEAKAHVELKWHRILRSRAGGRVVG